MGTEEGKLVCVENRWVGKVQWETVRIEWHLWSCVLTEWRRNFLESMRLTLVKTLSNGDIVSELANFCSQAILPLGVLGYMWLTSCPKG